MLPKWKKSVYSCIELLVMLYFVSLRHGRSHDETKYSRSKTRTIRSITYGRLFMSNGAMGKLKENLLINLSYLFVPSHQTWASGNLEFNIQLHLCKIMFHSWIFVSESNHALPEQWDSHAEFCLPEGNLLYPTHSYSQGKWKETWRWGSLEVCGFLR